MLVPADTSITLILSVSVLKLCDGRADCAKYDYLENCYVPPPCSEECLAAASNEQACSPACQQYRKVHPPPPPPPPPLT